MIRYFHLILSDRVIWQHFLKLLLVLCALYIVFILLPAVGVEIGEMTYQITRSEQSSGSKQVSRNVRVSAPRDSIPHRVERTFDLDAKRRQAQAEIDDTLDMIDRELARQP